MKPVLIKILQELCTAHGWECQLYADAYLMVVNNSGQKLHLYNNKFPHNDASVSRLCDDKSALSELLKAYQIPHIEHYYYGPSNHAPAVPAEKLLQQHGELVAKDNHGAGGRHVYRVKTIAELHTATQAIREAGGELCLSPYHELLAEYRVVVLDNQPQYIYEKIRHGSWQHNLSLGATPELVHDPKITQELTALVARVATVLPLNFMAVDIARDATGDHVLEINSGFSVEHFATASPENYALARETLDRALTQYFSML